MQLILVYQLWQIIPEKVNYLCLNATSENLKSVVLIIMVSFWAIISCYVIHLQVNFLISKTSGNLMIWQSFSLRSWAGPIFFTILIAFSRRCMHLSQNTPLESCVTRSSRKVFISTYKSDSSFFSLISCIYALCCQIDH